MKAAQFYHLFSADISCESPDSIRCSDAAGASCFSPRDACDDFDDCAVVSGEDETANRCGYDSSGSRDDHNKKNKDQVDSLSSSTEETDSTDTNDEGLSILLHVVLLFLLIQAMKYFECAYPPAVFEFVTRMRYSCHT